MSNCLPNAAYPHYVFQYNYTFMVPDLKTTKLWLFPLCFCSQPDDGYTLAETCSWYFMTIGVSRLDNCTSPQTWYFKKHDALWKSVKSNPKLLLWFTGINLVLFCGRQCSLGVTVDLQSDVLHILWIYSLVSVLVLNRPLTCEQRVYLCLIVSLQ